MLSSSLEATGDDALLLLLLEELRELCFGESIIGARVCLALLRLFFGEADSTFSSADGSTDGGQYSMFSVHGFAVRRLLVAADRIFSSSRAWLSSTCAPESCAPGSGSTSRSSEPMMRAFARLKSCSLSAPQSSASCSASSFRWVSTSVSSPSLSPAESVPAF